MNLKVTIILNILVITTILLPWHITGLYGFDWTDTTYNFQQALNILNNKKINQDFFLHVPGFSFLLEAFFLKIFGITYENHRNLGLIFPITQYMCSFLVVSKILHNYNQKNYQLWATILSTIILTTYWGIQISWDVGGLAITLSFILTTLLFLLYENLNKSYFFFIIFFITLITALQIFTKQSHGMINLIATFFSIFLILTLKKQNIYFIAKIIIVFFVFQLINIFLLSNLTGIDVPISFSQNSSSLGLKGLSINKPSEIFLTVFTDEIRFLFVIFISFLISFLLQKSIFKQFLPIILMTFSLLGYYYSKIWILLYFILIGFLFYQLYYFIKNFRSDKSIKNILFVLSFPLIGSVLAEQLSWPSFHYLNPTLLIFIALISTIYFIDDIKNLIFYKKLFITYLIFISIISIYLIEAKPRRYDHKSVGLIKIKNPESFKGWKVSKKTLKAINKLKEASASCKGNTLFQLSWMPISYEITSRINPTGYDLPYHDTITLEEAKSILKDLISKPPGMFIVQPKYASYSGPFPALGMKYIYNNLDGLLKNYKLNSEIEDNFNNFEVYCLN